MGADSSKNGVGSSRGGGTAYGGLNSAEATAIASMLNAKSPADAEPITPPFLMGLWEPLMTDSLLQMYVRQLFSASQGSNASIPFKKFAGMYSRLIKGTVNDVAIAVVTMATPVQNQPAASLAAISSYLNELWLSYVKMMAYYRNRPLRQWANAKATCAHQDVTCFSEYLLEDLESYDDQVSVGAVENWLFRTPFHGYLLGALVKAAYNVELPKEVEGLFPNTVMPNTFTTFLGLSHVGFLNWALTCGGGGSGDTPYPWRLLFSTATHGESWATFLKTILAQGPTIIIVQDSNGIVFGFYASQSWECRASFYGDQNCFLFTLRPELAKFEPTGYNKNFQYLNTGQTTLPNGLGAGGQLGYWGMFLDAEFGLGGVSKTCSTFRKYVPLSQCDKFRIANLEVWATGKADPTAKELGQRESRKGVLYADPSAEAFLEMAGKTIHSRGLRPEDDSNMEEPTREDSDDTI